MTAGRGVQHDGNPPAGTISHTLQLWINLPASAKMTEPRYQDLFGAAMPVRREPGVEARVFSGRSGDVVSPTLNHVPVTMVEARIEPGCAFDQPLAGGDNAFVYVLDGVAKIGAVAVPAGRLAWLTRPEQPRPSDVTIRTEDGAARVLIVAGPPLREPIAFGGPFVMNTQAEIRQAFEDFRAGRF
jgi:redox-sensitive bicupin YhaK (pirin superfamily)